MHKLPRNLVENFEFSKVFELRPKAPSKVLVYNKHTNEHEEKTIFRSYMSYLNTPKFDESVPKSFMFSNVSMEIPEKFTPFVDFAKSLDCAYNQMVVNWYEPSEYIESHRDCTAKMISKNSPILTLNFNESDDIYNLRSIIFEDVETKVISSVPLLNNSYFIIDNNNSHRHYVGRGAERRISITFRMMKESQE